MSLPQGPPFRPGQHPLLPNPHAALAPGSTSFTAYLAATPPPPPRGLMPEHLPVNPPAPRPPGRALPPGPPIGALPGAGGVVTAGDRRATMGNMIAQRDIEKV